MEEKKQKIRLGSGKKRNPTWITASICISEAQKNSYFYEGKEYVNININLFDTPNEYGKDVQVTLNDYKKTEQDLSSKI